ncbi:hypothetical protein QC761_700400 [Podospora bellae-mahoneyi]|uniref:Uncharacterized protein n=1 Tax=Podospora bellae-mahoneyi TaxID=2093777 RepID=A0ABR0F8E3_9PEZI|nr:hypothetical protein QC761_700400 [Podospora bellae-mahoneyi]
MSAAAHPNGHGNAHLPLASQATALAPAYQSMSEEIYQEVCRSMMASLDRVRQEDMRNFRDLHAAHKAALEQEQMDYTQQFFQLQKEMTALTKEGAAADADISKLEELLLQARNKRQEVASKISFTQKKVTDVQSLQHRKHAELQALAKKHEQDLKDKEMRWQQIHQDRLTLLESKKPSSLRQAQDQNLTGLDQAMADDAATASSPMQSLRAPQLAPGVSHQSTGSGGMFMGGPVQPPSLKAPTDNGPLEPPGLSVSKRIGAQVLEAPTLPRNHDAEEQRLEGASRPAASQKTQILQAPTGYQAPFTQPQHFPPPNPNASSGALVSVSPTVVPSVETPDQQTEPTVSEMQNVTSTESLNVRVPEEQATPVTVAALNGATDIPTLLQTSEEGPEADVSSKEGTEGKAVDLGVPAPAEVFSAHTEGWDVEMRDAAPPQAATETTTVLGQENAGPTIFKSPDQVETREAASQRADVEMSGIQITAKQSEVSPPTQIMDATASKLGTDSANVDNGSPALADTADSPLSDLSSIPSPPSDTFTHEGSPPRQPPSVSDDKLCVYDEDGRLVGQVRRLTHTTSSNIEKIAAFPLKRHVQIRSGRKFTSEDLDRVYHVSDVKGTKWTSCYIQATGNIQSQPCNTCAKHNGPYEECIILDADDSFPKCGNCEWNRQACVGASLRPKTASAPGPAPDLIAAAASAPASALEPTPATISTAISKPSFGSSFTAINSPSGDQQDSASAKDTADAAQNQAAPPVKKAGRKSLPTSRVQLPSHPGTPHAGSPEPAEPSRASLPEITKENLCLKDDGVVYTEPPFMAGVPLAKISPDHPYWEQDWDSDIASHVRKELEKWTTKFQEMDSQGIKDHRKYEAQRQINRGQLTLKFLEEGELHPYQLVGKAWMDTKKIIKYNTLYRLASTLMEDLPKMDLGMTPAEWMRHRLYEIYREQGPHFNLASTVASFYHDPKHAQVRAKNGIVSVGRPHKSATKPKTQTPGQEDNGSKLTPRALKRKEPHATPKAAPIPPKQEDAEPEPEPQQLQPQQPEPRPRSSPRKPAGLDHKPRPRSRSGNPPSAPIADSDDEGMPLIRAANATPPPPQAKKKIRVTSTVDPSNTPDLYYHGFTDVDSCSDDRLEQIDWRVNQIKTAEVSTNPGVTQYWHWVDDAHPGYCEHQVLKQLRPPKWAVFKEPYNFHLRTVDCEEIVYGPGSHRVIIRRKAHLQPKKGDMLAEFKRDRTKKRFLEFMHQRGVRIVRSNKEYVDGAWENLKPAFDMPGQDRDSD